MYSKGMPCCAICCQHCSAIMVAVHAWSYLHMLFVVGLLGRSSWRIFLHNISNPAPTVCARYENAGSVLFGRKSQGP